MAALAVRHWFPFLVMLPLGCQRMEAPPQPSESNPPSSELIDLELENARALCEKEDPTSPANFKGVIAKSYADSVEWWPPTYAKLPRSTPNVVVILLDDVGFAQVGSFGGLISTPRIDQLAANGLRFNNFHTTALCSPSRASLMAGRNPHSIGLGSHSLTAMGFPGYNAIIPEDAKSVAKILQEGGYVNYALGKWDHTPLYEVSQAGPFTRWPSGEGFDHFYGFMAADADQYHTVMFADHEPIEPWVGQRDYHQSVDLADKAIDYVTGHMSTAPDRPFMLFLAPGAMHSPHQVPQAYIDRYRGKFDQGWDHAREAILTRQVELGVIPPGTELTARAPAIPAWDSLNPEEQRLYARQMEVFAGMMEHLDVQIGRVVDTLERVGALDNTLLIVTSDNGASGEGGLAGTFNETYILNGLQTEFAANMRHYDDWGGPTTYPHYHAGWAMAGNTPFRYFKQAVHNGGIQDPMIVHWPERVTAKGEIRSQYHHISDIAPTILEATGVEMPAVIDGVEQRPMDGVSMLYSFTDGSAPSPKHVQYYEMYGNRSIWVDGWQAVTLHGQRMPWDVDSVTPFEDDVWELYNLEEDFSAANDLAAEEPERLAELQHLWDLQAEKYDVYPLYDDMIARLARQQDRLFGNKTEFVYYAPGAVRIAEKASPPIKGRSHSIDVELDLHGGEQGVIVACGGFTGGYTMYVAKGRVHYDYNYLDGVHYTLQSPPLGRGKVDVAFEYEDLGGFAGRGKLMINGEVVDTVDMPRTHRTTFSLSEPFDVGVDHGTPVTTAYPKADHFPYTGELDRVTFRLL